MIYLIGDGTDAVKIGYTEGEADPLQALVRASQLQTGNPRPLSVLAVMDGDVLAEQALHTVFAEERIRREWFRYSERIRGHFAPHACNPPLVVPDDVRKRLERRPRRVLLHCAINIWDEFTVCLRRADRGYCARGLAEFGDESVDLDRCPDCKRRVFFMNLPRRAHDKRGDGE